MTRIDANEYARRRLEQTAHLCLGCNHPHHDPAHCPVAGCACGWILRRFLAAPTKEPAMPDTQPVRPKRSVAEIQAGIRAIHQVAAEIGFGCEPAIALARVLREHREELAARIATFAAAPAGAQRPPSPLVVDPALWSTYGQPTYPGPAEPPTYPGVATAERLGLQRVQHVEVGQHVLVMRRDSTATKPYHARVTKIHMGGMPLGDGFVTILACGNQNTVHTSELYHERRAR